jgi:hypothetical protein
MSHRSGFAHRRGWLAVLVLSSISLIVAAAANDNASARVVSDSAVSAGQSVELSGHLLPAVAKAIRVHESAQQLRARARDPITLTLVLKREHQAEFDRYRREVYDPGSPNFHRFLSQEQIADRFGPSKAAYDGISAYFRAQGFKLVAGSANRLTLTIKGTRREAEQTLAVHFDDYQWHQRRFFANDRNPMLPAEVAANVESIVGLSNLAVPDRPHTLNIDLPQLDEVPPCAVSITKSGGTSVTGGELACTCALSEDADPSGIGSAVNALGGVSTPARDALNYQCAADELNLVAFAAANGGATSARASRKNSSANFSKVAGQPGAGQKIGLLEFDNFHQQDVQDFLALVGSGANIANLSEVDVGGGAGAPGGGESEVLLDIDAVMALAPGAQVVVFDGPFSGPGSFQTMLNAMINAGVTIISNSWAYCEDQTTAADVNSLDSVLSTAAVAGITVVTGAGDSGTTCLDGAANTVAVPADSPDITAVGGTTAIVNALGSYGSESYWDGSHSSPQTGQGGMGLSKFFARPNYQAGLNTMPMRSVPDVTAPADPINGFSICQADAGGCPNHLLYGGTSLAAPIWAALVAGLNHQLGHNVGLLNPLIYPLANSDAFHSAYSMGSDFAHVGLGSPNIDQLFVALSGATIGAPDLANSLLAVAPGTAPADGNSVIGVAVVLLDANFNTVSGQSVTLSANGGSQATITPINNLTNVSNGAALFLVTDTVPEDVTLSATIGGGTLAQTQDITFVTPPATAASIGANPSTVAANGSSSSTITVTLHDASNNPTPGKQVKLDQGNGHSIVSGPNPNVTDSNGQIQFTATDVTTETVSYTATDVTDGNLAVPGSANVSFTGGSGTGCASGPLTATMGSQFTYTNFITGFPTGSENCLNPSGMAFDSAGNIFVADYAGGSAQGGIYKFPPSGGVASPAFRLNSSPYAAFTCASGLAFSKDGQHLYLARQGCNSGGDVVEVSPTDGSVLRTLTTLDCASGLATDPISGDLFVSQPCPRGSSNITRISNPDTSPSASVYSNGVGGAGALVFTPDGTLWTEAFRFDQSARHVAKIAGTNTGTPGSFTYVADAFNNAFGILPALNPADAANPQFILSANAVATTGSGGQGDISLLDLTGAMPAQSDIFNQGSVVSYIIAGPDGCAYATESDRVIRITKTDGTCPFASSSPLAALSLSPSTVSPNPALGTPLSFTASLTNVSSAAGTPIYFLVSGANVDAQQQPADANGQASFTYSGTFTGTDNVVAFAPVNGSSLSSNPAQVTWAAGKDLTFLGLNQAPTSAMPGQAVTVTGQLSDISQSPAVPLQNQQINFAIGSGNCMGTTDSNGVAGCQLTPSGSAITTLTADFAGTNSLAAAHAQSPFAIVQPAAQPTPVPGKLKIAPKQINFGTVLIGANKVRTVTIKNLGRITKKKTALPITIEVESASSPDAPSPFSVSMDCPPDDQLDPGAKGQKPGKCQVQVEFAPQAAQAFTGTLSIFDNLEPNLVQTVPLKGKGKAPKM